MNYSPRRNLFRREQKMEVFPREHLTELPNFVPRFKAIENSNKSDAFWKDLFFDATRDHCPNILKRCDGMEEL